MKTYTKIMSTSVVCLLLFNVSGQQVPDPKNVKPTLNTIDVVKRYTSSGWMGDGKDGTKYVQIDEACKINARPKRQTCIKITYAIGPERWAGIYWLNKPDNWGDKPGEDFSAKAFKRVTFWARGERGGEVVEFKTGGVSGVGKPYKDSFEETTGKVTLEKDWKKYSVNIEGQNLSSVIGVFCWVANGTSNANGLTFYLDEIQFE